MWWWWWKLHMIISPWISSPDPKGANICLGHLFPAATPATACLNNLMSGARHDARWYSLLAWKFFPWSAAATTSRNWIKYWEKLSPDVERNRKHNLVNNGDQFHYNCGNLCIIFLPSIPSYLVYFMDCVQICITKGLTFSLEISVQIICCSLFRSFLLFRSIYVRITHVVKISRSKNSEILFSLFIKGVECL